MVTQINLYNFEKNYFRAYLYIYISIYLYNYIYLCDTDLQIYRYMKKQKKSTLSLVSGNLAIYNLYVIRQKNIFKNLSALKKKNTWSPI